MNTVTHSYKLKIIIKDRSCPRLQRQSLSEHRLYIKDGKPALMSPIDWLGLNVKLHLAALKPDITSKAPSNGGLETSQWRLGTHQRFGN